MAVYNRVENRVAFQYGITFGEGVQVPADDRIVLDYEDLYIDSESPTEATLYRKAYTGMIVTVFENDGKPTILVLKNAAPYTSGTVETISASNYKNYWYSPSSESITEDISDLKQKVIEIDSSIVNLNTSINNVSSYVDALRSDVSAIDTEINTSIVDVSTFAHSVNTSTSDAISLLQEYDTSIYVSLEELIQENKQLVDASLVALDASIMALDASYEDLKKIVIDNEYVTAVALNKLNDNDTSIYDSLVSLVQNSNNLANASIEALESSIIALDASYADLRNIVREDEQVTAAALNTLNDNDTSIYNSLVSLVNDSNDFVNESIEELEIRIEAFESSIIALDASYVDLRNIIREDEQVIANALNTLNNNDTSIYNSLVSLVQDSNNLANASIEALDASYVDLRNIIREDEQVIANALNTLNDNDTSIYNSLVSLVNDSNDFVNASIEALDASCSELLEIIYENEQVTAESLNVLNDMIYNNKASIDASILAMIKTANENEQVIAESLNDLNNKINKIMDVFVNGGIKTRNFDSAVVNESIRELYRLIQNS